MSLTTNKKNENYEVEYNCIYCYFKCSYKCDWDRHILSNKHIRLIKTNNIIEKNENVIICTCGKKYKHLSSLCKHKKKCSIKYTTKKESEIDCDDNDTDNCDELHNNSHLILEILKQNQGFKEFILEKPQPSENNDSLVLELLKQNQEFKELMIEQNKYMMEQGKQMIDIAKNAGNNTNCNNTNNTKFNMQFFLNETCKNAMSITEFVDSLELTFEDLENVGRVGYAEGISQIFIKGIRATEICKRPIHCSDIKRVVMFINDINGWEKDSNSNEKIIRLIKQIAKKNMKQASVWISQHQHIVHGHGSREQKQYSTMIGECFGGGTAEEDTKNYNKIIKRIAPEIYIDKYKN